MSTETELPAVIQVFMTEMRGLMSNFGLQIKASNEMFSQRLDAMADKHKSEIDSLKQNDNHIKANFDQKIVALDQLHDKRVTKIEDQLCDVQAQIAVNPAEKARMDEHMATNTSRLDQNTKDIEELKNYKKWIIGLVGGIVFIACGVFYAQVSHSGLLHLFG